MKFEEKSIQVIEFSGKKDDWNIWSQKFLARSSKRGYKSLIDGTTKIPKQSEYNSVKAVSQPNDNEKQIIERYELSLAAFKDLVFLINGETRGGKVAFELVDGCVTTENPDNDVY